jgi:hypothetical protein
VKQLRETLELLSPAVPRKPSIKVLSYVRFGEGRAMVNGLQLAAALFVICLLLLLVAQIKLL